MIPIRAFEQHYSKREIVFTRNVSSDELKILYVSTGGVAEKQHQYSEWVALKSKWVVLKTDVCVANKKVLIYT